MTTTPRRTFVTIIIALVAGTFITCGPSRAFIGEEGATKGIESKGIWKFKEGEFNNSQSGKLKITEDGTFDFWAEQMGLQWVIKGTLEKFDNEIYNCGATGEGDYGYAVVKIHDGMIKIVDGSAIGEYVVVRWKNLEPGKAITFAISKGSKYFDHKPTVEEAEAELTTENNFRDFLTARCIDPLDSEEELSPIEIEGTWRKEHGLFDIQKYTITVSGESLKVVNDKDEVKYAGKIVKYNNNMLNAGGEGQGDCGYAIVELEEGDNVGSNAGKFAVIRWDNFDGSSTVDFVMSNNAFTMAVKDTKEEAEKINQFVTTLQHFNFKGAQKQ